MIVSLREAGAVGHEVKHAVLNKVIMLGGFTGRHIVNRTGTVRRRLIERTP